ncbi:hypothetical protein BH09MYX1_BH09MYX1_65900 [soil metagenome]
MLSLGRALIAFVLLAACRRGQDEVAPSGKTLIAVTADENGFAPSAIDVNKDEPTALAFTRTSDDTCAKEVVFPELDVKKELPLNKTVYVEIPSGAARSFTFTCGMGMYKSAIVVK